MLISDKYNFLFIHIYKNAGTSITHALKPFAVNRLHNYAHLVFYRLFRSNILNPMPFSPHVTATEIINKIGYEKYRQYYSFAVVRNPWDWQVSLYKFMLKKENHYQHKLIKSMSNFTEYIEWRCKNETRLQKDFIYSKDDNQLVDFIAKFENLETDFQKICKHIGVTAKLPHLNISNKIPYQKFYTDETMKLVKNTFSEDINLFGYQFN